MCEHLRTAKFGNGLELLGTSERTDNGAIYLGAFEGSAAEHIELPSTLKRIECNTFRGCQNLKDIRFPDGLETIRQYCFQQSGLKKLVIPASMKEIEKGAFAYCE